MTTLERLKIITEVLKEAQKEERIATVKKEDLPYPFNGKDTSIDFSVRPGKDDHKWLEDNGYLVSEMMPDCSFSLLGVPWFLPSSYGNWGTVFNDTTEEGWNILMLMFEDGIVNLWRTRNYNRDPKDVKTEEYTIEDFRAGKKPIIVS